MDDAKLKKFEQRCTNMIAVESLISTERDLHGRWRQVTYTYHRPFNDLGFYISPVDKYSGDNMLRSPVEEGLILPHTPDELRKRFTSHLGFMFTFLIDKEETVQILDRLDTAVTTVQFALMIRRFDYRLKGNRGIIIDHVRDPIIPPGSFTFSCPTRQLDDTKAETFYSMMMDYGLHFAIFDI